LLPERRTALTENGDSEPRFTKRTIFHRATLECRFKELAT
jgi:hypothetical protein